MFNRFFFYIYKAFCNRKQKQNFILQKKNVRWPGIEPGSTAWKATMLTITPPSHLSVAALYTLANQERLTFAYLIRKRQRQLDKFF